MRCLSCADTQQTLWQALYPVDLKAVSKLQLFNIRSALHGEPVVLLTAIGSSGVQLVPFNPHSGAVFSAPGLTATTHNLDVLAVFALPFHDTEFHNVLAIVGKDVAVTLLPNQPSSHTALAAYTKPVYFQSIDVPAGVISGYQLNSGAGSLTATLLSRVVFNPATETIAAVSVKGEEPMPSLGEPLGDRKVLYKFVNAFSIAVATLSNYTRNAATLNVYVVNGVRGDIIDQVAHHGVQGPVHLVHSENWVVYHYLNKDEKRYEAAVTELYENGEPSSVTSAFKHGDPIVIRQTYILPTAVSAIGLTVTQKGITFRQLLLALPCGSVMGVHKRFIDARRPIEDRGAATEGLMPYRPILPIAQQMGINYNLSVFRPRTIYSAPSGLESTSLVLVAGLDLFFAPVTPSKQFDLLSGDFNFAGLTLSLIALAAGVVALQKLAARKQLVANWA